MASPTLPNEITDRIIDELRSDKHALRACALVARDWVVRSRFHLFRSITLAHEAAADRFLAAGPAVAAPVRELAIKVTVDEDGALHAPGLASWRRLPELLARLAGVRALELHHQFVRPALAARLAAAFPALEALVVRACSFASWTDLAALLESHPQLERVELHHVGWALAGRAPDAVPVSTPEGDGCEGKAAARIRPRSLSLSSVPVERVPEGRGLAELVDVSALRRFEAGLFSPGALAFFHRAARDERQQIEHLTLTVPWDGLRVLDTSALLHLKHFRLSVAAATPGSDSSSTVGLAQTIEALAGAAPALVALTVELPNARFNREALRRDWRPVADALRALRPRGEGGGGRTLEVRANCADAETFQSFEGAFEGEAVEVRNTFQGLRRPATA